VPFTIHSGSGFKIASPAAVWNDARATSLTRSVVELHQVGLALAGIPALRRLGDVDVARRAHRSEQRGGGAEVGIVVVVVADARGSATVEIACRYHHENRRTE